ncbi:glutamic acid-rich protein-like [Engraulis encrasicolus]|uniref:glutamic acid-rich protein-like n=1 Tax=Engraulis encrasicolus TaxID=184585 RepID=UPI002FD0651F
MRLKDFFCCCLPAPGDNSNYDEKGSPGSTKEDNSNQKKSGKGLWKRMTTPSKKKLRKEAKKLRHEMADRKRKEVHVMDIILEAEDEPMMITHPLVLRKETPEENVEDERVENVVFHKTLVHATQHSQDVAGPVVGIPQGETAQAKAEFPLSIDVLEMVYANLSSGIDMGLLCHLVQLSKDLRKGDSCGGDQPFQNGEPPALVPTNGELSHLTMHEEKEEEEVLEEEEEKVLEEEKEEDKEEEVLEEDKEEEVLEEVEDEEEEEEEEEKEVLEEKEEEEEEVLEEKEEEEEKKKEGALLVEEEVMQLTWFHQGGLSVFNTAAEASAAAATQMKYVFAQLSNIFEIMMHKIYYFINRY